MQVCLVARDGQPNERHVERLAGCSAAHERAGVARSERRCEPRERHDGEHASCATKNAAETIVARFDKQLVAAGKNDNDRALFADRSAEVRIEAGKIGRDERGAGGVAVGCGNGAEDRLDGAAKRWNDRRRLFGP